MRWNYINRDNVYSSDLNVDFIELYINNEYSGLYTYKNIVNRNKLNLKKINSDDFGILVKGINYKPIDWDATNLSNIEGAIYNSLEMKYPKDDINISKSWEIILPKLGAHYQNHTNSLELIQNNFIQENFINYKIFTELIGAIDNTHIKNMFFSMSNIKSNILITPWDLDLSFGLTYTENSLTNYSVKIYNQVNKPLISSNYIGDEDYIKALKERYYYLRQNGLNKYYLFNLIDNYVNEIYYASIRDSERWYEYDIIKETKEIKDWISKRFDFLDKKFKEL